MKRGVNQLLALSNSLFESLNTENYTKLINHSNQYENNKYINKYMMRKWMVVRRIKSYHLLGINYENYWKFCTRLFLNFLFMLNMQHENICVDIGMNKACDTWTVVWSGYSMMLCNQLIQREPFNQKIIINKENHISICWAVGGYTYW